MPSINLLLEADTHFFPYFTWVLWIYSAIY
jgi:hypothetical protein